MNKLITKLQSANSRIQSFNYIGQVSEEAFFDLVNLQFIDPILRNKTAAHHFRRVFNYYDEIEEDEGYKALNNTIIEAVCSMGQDLMKRGASKQFKQYKPKDIKNPYKHKNDKEMVNLSVLCKIAFQQESYATLKEIGGMTMGDISFRYGIKAFFEQYEWAKHLLVTMLRAIEKNLPDKIIGQLRLQYRDIEKNVVVLEEKLVTTPKRFNYPQYEMIAFDYYKRVPNNLLKPDAYYGWGFEPGPKQVAGIKQAIQLIYEDIALLDYKDEAQNQESEFLPIKQGKDKILYSPDNYSFSFNGERIHRLIPNKPIWRIFQLTLCDKPERRIIKTTELVEKAVIKPGSNDITEKIRKFNGQIRKGLTRIKAPKSVGGSLIHKDGVVVEISDVFALGGIPR
jgi:hypothetical protein